MPTMKASLFLHTKEIKGDEIVEIKIWQAPKTKDKPHGVKFSLVYIKKEERLIGYDNAEAKDTTGIFWIRLNLTDSQIYGSLWMILKRI